MGPFYDTIMFCEAPPLWKILTKQREIQKQKIQAREVILIADTKKIFGKIVHYFTKEEFIQQQIVAIVV